MLGLGASLGLWQVARSAPLARASAWIDAGMGVLAGMLLGARLAYVSAHPAYYASRPLEALAPWQGGLSAWGALPGGLLAALVAALLLRSKLLQLLDGLAPLLPPLAVLGWLGCAAAGVGYGPELPANTWYALPLVDEWGRVAPRLPLQAAAALLLLGYNWVIAAALPHSAWPGLRAALSGLGLAAVQLAAAMLAAEPVPLWNGYPMDAWAAAALAALSLILLFFAILFRGRR